MCRIKFRRSRGVASEPLDVDASAGAEDHRVPARPGPFVDGASSPSATASRQVFSRAVPAARSRARSFPIDLPEGQLFCNFAIRRAEGLNQLVVDPHVRRDLWHFPPCKAASSPSIWRDHREVCVTFDMHMATTITVIAHKNKGVLAYIFSPRERGGERPNPACASQCLPTTLQAARRQDGRPPGHLQAKKRPRSRTL